MHLLPLAQFPTITAPFMALLLAGVIVIFTVRRWRANVVRRNAAADRAVFIPTPEDDIDESEAASPPVAAPLQTRQQNPLNVREVSTELAALLADLEETSRRVASQIDNRRTGLELLLKEADEKIRRLEMLSKPTPPETRPAPVALSPDAAQLIARLRQERSSMPPAAVEDPAYRPIYQLADAGQSPREIAQQLHRNPGEIELILALRPRQRT